MLREPFTAPDELKRQHLAHQQEQDRLSAIRRQRFRRRWMACSALIGVIAAAMNYMLFIATWHLLVALAAHGLLFALGGLVVVVYHRGHLSAMALVGLPNVILSFVWGFNPFGTLTFLLAGAFVGAGVDLERDL